MSLMSLKGVIRNGRVEVEEPIDLQEGTEVVVTSAPLVTENAPMSPEEIARIHTAMQQLLPLNIPDDVFR